MRTSLGAEFVAAFDRYRDRTAVESAGRRWTFADLDRWSAAVARQLQALGVAPGDPVALHLGNGVQFVVADVAVARLGAVKVPINTLLPADTVRYVVEAVGARVTIVDPALGVDVPGPVVLVDDLAGPSPAPAPPPPPIGPDARAAIYFTGGTTGRPKGVVHTQASAVALQYAQLLEAEIAQDDRLLLTHRSPTRPVRSPSPRCSGARPASSSPASTPTPCSPPCASAGSRGRFSSRPCSTACSTPSTAAREIGRAHV